MSEQQLKSGMTIYAVGLDMCGKPELCEATIDRVSASGQTTTIKTEPSANHAFRYKRRIQTDAVSTTPKQAWEVFVRNKRKVLLGLRRQVESMEKQVLAGLEGFKACGSDD